MSLRNSAHGASRFVASASDGRASSNFYHSRTRRTSTTHCCRFY